MANKGFANRARHAFLRVSLVLTALAAGCVYPTSSTNITPAGVGTVAHNPHAVSIEVSGGSSASAWSIQDTVLRNAAAQAVSRLQVFKHITGPDTADVLMRAQILGHDFKEGPYTTTAIVTVRWALLRPDGSVIWDDTLESRGATNMSETPTPVKRPIVASERAAGANIRMALERIPELSPP